MAPHLHGIGLFSQSAVVIILFIGAFSRFTHGRFTPRFYAYQLDRAPDDASTRVIPFMDTLLGTLNLFPATRAYALAACVLFQSFGIVVRVRQGKSLIWDLALYTVTAVACWSAFSGR
ncbi:hypothetical protein ACRE_026630 [Hapsidospora chrysogenum ATCC 11550]|uniref:Uncharacterized protein n=1 Tax=Hapsidospora chrysogenum (strain ATCC 11550 / CBS 779.69 / DSM 880 / IAM 14645 / JCM 23072 / IMI 49137) TaxID=857340 RepID=A0A086TAW4_HAPC1|nr:hypothetical protein ACRE_026630 [Hapsidospora chrysogenum ATCC 11550]